MPNTPIIAPPFHVQSTAAKLKNGFPYFPIHDSVSALWTQQWRMLCQHGIYPFVHANIADFDPIFAELVKISGDDSAFLYQPDEYARPFMPVAENLVAQAEQAQQQGDTNKATDFYLRASAVYHLARYPINRSPLSEEAWQKGKAAYLKAAPHLNPPDVALDIPFKDANIAAGDADAPIQTFLRMPTGTKPEAGWPVVLCFCGLDGYRTDFATSTQAHVDRGFATITFEIPGTGDCPAAPGDPDSPDRLMTSVLDWVVENAAQYGFDTTKIIAHGMSTGGYYAMRIAHTHADRLFAVVSQGGACHYVFDAAWIGAQNQMEYPFALADAVAYKFGFRDADPLKAYAAGGSKFSLLDSGVLDRPSARLLVLDGMEDSIFPIEDSFIVAAAGVNKELVCTGNQSHMGGQRAEKILCDWIDNAVAGKP